MPTDEHKPTPSWKSLGVCVPIAFGFLFLLASLYYTRLAIDGAGLAAKMNTALAIDFDAKSDNIIAMLRLLVPPDTSTEGAVTETAGPKPKTDVRAAAEAQRALNELRFHVATAYSLMNEIRPTNQSFGYEFLKNGWQISYQRQEESGVIDSAAEKDIKVENIKDAQGVSSTPPANEENTGKAKDNADAQNTTLIPYGYPALADYDGFSFQISNFAFNSIGGERISPLSMLISYGLERDKLLANIEITNKWTLPVLYGALGAVLYVLARHFNPFVASLNLGRVLLRITFAMFVAVTISMLFIPANVISPVATSSPSGIFLLCFIAGYSTDTFIRFLAKLNTYFAMPAPRNTTS